MEILFDIIIFGYIIFGSLAVFYLSKKYLKTKRSAWIVLIAILTLSILTVIWGSFIEPRIITVNEQNLELGDKGKKIRVALMADLHLGPYKGEGFVKRLGEKLGEIDPDVVVFSGDLIHSSYNQEKVDERLELLASLKYISDEFPTYAVSGNHEYVIGKRNDFSHYYDSTPKLKTMLKEAGVRYLSNESVLIDDKIWLTGLEEVWAQLANPQKALGVTNDDYSKVLLVHNPDFFYDFSAQAQNFDLVLSGHTHGGQIRLPLIGSIVKLPTEFGRQYDRGLFQIKNTWLFITRGIGETGTRARLFNPPEIVVFDIEL